MSEIRSLLDQMTIDGALAEPMGEGNLRCTACAHRCLLHPGKRGICGVRFNQQGTLRVPWGYTAGIAIDPIEKKPFGHFLPGEEALTFGMLGCNFHCDFCQNWHTSQVLHDPNLETTTGMFRKISPEELVRLAIQSGAKIIASSYNEPIITAEWARDIFSVAKLNGLHTVMISNGYATPEALDYLHPVLDGYKIDLKSMRDRNYRAMGGVLSHVLDSIAHAYELGLWVEVVTLVIPEYNNSPEELWDAARAIREVSEDIPWHVTGFHPDYKMLASRATMPLELQVAADIGQEAGLHYVYAGNLPGKVGSMENTYCPSCSRLLVGRSGYTLTEYHISGDGTCPDCHTKIAGVWAADAASVNLGKSGFPWMVR